ncbi:MAG TPA: EH signature domain-containing protein [Nostocaceae cyanobacterium]|nr:EH signature domain-containing protein [Nostocaceae cyanobacterium]
MNFNFTLPNLPESPQFFPQNMMVLASTLSDAKIPIPSVDKVLAAIKQGKADEVSKLEWVYCIYAKAEWDQKNIHIANYSSSRIWQVAVSNYWLQHYLLWRLTLYYNSQNNQRLADSLSQTFHIFANSSQVKNLLQVKIVLALKNTNPGEELAKIAGEYLVNRSQLINKVNGYLPIWISAFNQFSQYITPYFCKINTPSESHVNWLLSCFEEMLDDKQAVAVDYLLVNISQNIGSKHIKLVEWLRKNYRSGEKWYKLSETARKKLRDLIGAINYADFQKLVDLILHKISLEEWERNRLTRRKEFWYDYSRRFERLRILIPESSSKSLGDYLKGDIDILKNDGSEPTEICIFDFGEWIVVEFFRGKGSETRIFPNNPKNQQVLFDESQLSVKRIRGLGGDRHDHVYLWQEFCPKWLEKKGIIPNSGYIPTKSIDNHRLLDREYQLQNWEIVIEKLEREAKNYCCRMGYEIN